MSSTIHLMLVFHVFIAVAVMVMVCGRHGCGYHGIGPSINTITPELSSNFQGIILRSKGRPASKMAIAECASGDFSPPMFSFVTLAPPGE